MKNVKKKNFLQQSMHERIVCINDEMIVKVNVLENRSYLFA